MSKKENMILKIGITPSNAPFRITCLRTFLYIYAIAEKNALLGGNSKIIFQIDDTNEKRRLHSDDQIFDFYEKIGMLPPKYSEVIKTIQTDLKEECENFFKKLRELGFIIHMKNSLYSFDIEKYKEIYGNTVYVNDILHGNIAFELNNVTKQGYINIKRSNGTFLYNFSSAIDTIHWQFTHLIRGNDKLSSAVFQNMIMITLGYKPPVYLHIPLLLEEKNSLNFNAKDDFRDLLKKYGISYMSAINYILNTGYGDNSDFYPSIEAFNQQFDINKMHKNDAHFDFNILKKTHNRFYQNDMSYDEYYEQLKRHLLLIDYPTEILKYSEIGYRNKLSAEKVIILYHQMEQEHFDDISNDLEKKVEKLIELLMNDYETAIVQLLSDKERKKENLQLVKYILCGYQNGLSSDIYRQCYTEKEYIQRLKYVRSRLYWKK